MKPVSEGHALMALAIIIAEIVSWAGVTYSWLTGNDHAALGFLVLAIWLRDRRKKDSSQA